MSLSAELAAEEQLEAGEKTPKIMLLMTRYLASHCFKLVFLNLGVGCLGDQRAADRGDRRADEGLGQGQAAGDQEGSH